MKKKMTLAELATLREAGVVRVSDEEIALKRAQRAEKRARLASEAEVKSYFPSFEGTKTVLRVLTAQVRNLRKDAVEKKVTSFSLPQEMKKKIFMALEKLDYSRYQTELGDLCIECLKVQDREVKVFTYNFLDRLFASDFIDWPMLLRMLNKLYVSRYGWALIRRHATKLSVMGAILGSYLDRWAQDPDTLVKWNRLASDEGGPVDIREMFPPRSYK